MVERCQPIKGLPLGKDQVDHVGCLPKRQILLDPPRNVLPLEQKLVFWHAMKLGELDVVYFKWACDLFEDDPR